MRWSVPPTGARVRDRASSAVPSGSDIQVPESADKSPLLSVAGVLATGFGAGLVPIAPGTVGSALAVVLFVPLRGLPVGVYLLVVAGVLAVGVWAAGVTQLATGRPDDGRIVIDEVAGQLLTLCPLLFLRPLRAGELLALLVTGFVAFRVLDIWKPGPVRWAEKNLAGGTGVMADDVVAGALGAVLLLLGLALAGALGWIADPFAPGGGS